MRIEVDGQHFEVPDDATPDEIDALTKPAAPPPQREPTIGERLKYAAHRTAGLLPAAGGIAGGALGGGIGGAIGFPTTGPGGIVTTAAGAGVGAGLGAAGGKALQHFADSALGYEKAPSIPDTIKDSAKTGAQDAAFTAAGGVLVPTLAAGVGRLAPAVDSIGNRFARRVLTGGATPMTLKKPLSDAALDAASEAGAFKPWLTTKGAAQVLGGARNAAGDEYGRVMQVLEQAGVTGPNAQTLATEYVQRGQMARANTLNPAVPATFEDVAQQLHDVTTEAKPITGSYSAQGRPEYEFWRVHRGEGSATPRAVADDVLNPEKWHSESWVDDSDLRKGLSAMESPQDLARYMQAHAGDLRNSWLIRMKGVLAAERDFDHSEGSRLVYPTTVLSAEPVPQDFVKAASIGGSPRGYEYVPPSGSLGLTQAENMKRSLQGMAKSSYQKFDPNEVGEAKEEAASMLRQSIEDAVSAQAAAAPDEAAAFVPIKQKLSGLIEAGNAADRGAAMADRRHALSLTDLLAFTGGTAHGGQLEGAGMALLSKLARTYGPSTAAWAGKGGARLLEAAAAQPANALSQIGAEAGAATGDGSQRLSLQDVLDILRRRGSAMPAPQ